MRKIFSLMTAMVLSSPVHAGDLVEGYLLVVGSIPSTITLEEQTDYAKPEFRDTVSRLSVEWSEKCGVHVDVWHTSLIYNEETPWTPDYWVAYIAFGDSEADVYDTAPATACISESYAKAGSIAYPSVYQWCVMKDETIEEWGYESWAETCT